MAAVPILASAVAPPLFPTVKYAYSQSELKGEVILVGLATRRTFLLCFGKPCDSAQTRVLRFCRAPHC